MSSSRFPSCLYARVKMQSGREHRLLCPFAHSHFFKHPITPSRAAYTWLLWFVCLRGTRRKCDALGNVAKGAIFLGVLLVFRLAAGPTVVSVVFHCFCHTCVITVFRRGWIMELLCVTQLTPVSLAHDKWPSTRAPHLLDIQTVPLFSTQRIHTCEIMISYFQAPLCSFGGQRAPPSRL